MEKGKIPIFPVVEMQKFNLEQGDHIIVTKKQRSMSTATTVIPSLKSSIKSPIPPMVPYSPIIEEYASYLKAKDDDQPVSPVDYVIGMPHGANLKRNKSVFNVIKETMQRKPTLDRENMDLELGIDLADGQPIAINKDEITPAPSKEPRKRSKVGLKIDVSKSNKIDPSRVVKTTDQSAIKCSLVDIKTVRFGLKKTPRDGDSLFRALSFLLLGNPSEFGVMNLRGQLAAHALNNPKSRETKELAALAEEYASLISVSGGLPGGDAEIDYFAREFGIPICCINVVVEPENTRKTKRFRFKVQAHEKEHIGSTKDLLDLNSRLFLRKNPDGFYDPFVMIRQGKEENIIDCSEFGGPKVVIAHLKELAAFNDKRGEKESNNEPFMTKRQVFILIGACLVIGSAIVLVFAILRVFGVLNIGL